jgi:hypothetical protein
MEGKRVNRKQPGSFVPNVAASLSDDDVTPGVAQLPDPKIREDVYVINRAKESARLSRL